MEIISSLKIYDRWGNMVYHEKDLRPNDPYDGWKGLYKDKKLDPAVFVYVAEVLFLNGEKKVYYGDVTLIR